LDFEALRKYFAYKPIAVVNKTIAAAAITQYARNVMRLPMRRNFKSRWPGLRMNRLDEVYATDTYFSNVPPIPD
jgi:hypothetical protein